MRFKTDENLPQEAVAFLLNAGHDAVSIRDQGLNGAPDATVTQVCRDERRALLTLDHGFADPRAYSTDGSPGIIVLRLKQHGKRHVLDLLQKLLHHLDSEPLENRLWVVTERHIRIRG